MIRKAVTGDIKAIADIYDKIIDAESSKGSSTGWIKGVYPTEATAREALDRGDLFILEDNGTVCGAAIINQTQVPVYAQAEWNNADAPDYKVMVMHTLVIDPDCSGKGFGTQFVHFYEDYAKENGCPYLRMDTNEKNLAARKLYSHLGYREAGIVPCEFNGIKGVNLVCLEKTLDD